MQTMNHIPVTPKGGCSAAPEAALPWLCQRMEDGGDYQVQLAYADFLPIRAEGRLHYGGGQAWFQEPFYAKAGCGSVAVADLMAYAALHDGKEGLYVGPDEGDTLSQDGFLQHMDAVIDVLTPTALGIPWVPFLQCGAERFARAHGYEVAQWHVLHGQRKGASAQKEAENYVLFNLLENRPMACIHWGGVKALSVQNHTEVPEGHVVDMNWHWVVVTALEKRGGVGWVTVSSCGWKYVLPFEAFLGGRPSMVAAVFRKK